VLLKTQLDAYFDGVNRTTFLVRVLLAVTGVGSLAVLAWSWALEHSQPLTCGVEMDTLATHNSGRFVVLLNVQDPVEPVFSGSAYLGVSKVVDTTLDSVSIETRGHAGYLPSVMFFPFRFTPGTNYLNPGKQVPYYVDSYTTSHRSFPFDSPKFSFTVRTDPIIHIDQFRVENRVNGMHLDCASMRIQRGVLGEASISFAMRRNTFVQVSSLILGAGAFLFCALILVTKDPNSLATAVASYFFTIWSVRSIVSTHIRVFPTLLDLWLLALSILLLFGVLWKLIGAKRSNQSG
jgi:hypothetical protein